MIVGRHPNISTMRDSEGKQPIFTVEVYTSTFSRPIPILWIKEEKLSRKRRWLLFLVTIYKLEISPSSIVVVGRDIKRGGIKYPSRNETQILSWRT